MNERKDRDERVPLRSDEQEYPQPERPMNAQEKPGSENNPEMDKPSQAEGERESE